MVDVFISYSRADAAKVAQLARMVEAEGYKVWWDADLPPHQSYGDVITAKISAARAAIVVWSASSVQSEWVRAEADMARNQKKLIQTSLDEVMPPLPFNQIQYAPIGDWLGQADHSGWRKVKASLSELCGPRDAATAPPPPRPAPAYAPPPPAPAPSGGTPWGMIAGIGIGAVGIGAAAAMYLMANGEPEENQPPAPLPTQQAQASEAAGPDEAAAPPAVVANQAPAPASAPPPNLPSPVFDLTATVEDPDGYTNVRASPSLRAQIVNRVQVGERFATYRQAGTWWRVRLADGGTGFIARSRIRLPGEEATPAPTATRLTGDAVQLRRVISKQP